MRSIRRLSIGAVVLVALMVLALALFGCSSGTTTTTGVGGSTSTTSPTSTSAVVTNASIVIALNGEPTSMDALTKEDGNMRAVTEQIYEALVTLDAKTLDPVAVLATEWSQPDATTWQFKLRQGVTFHNGDPFTVDDAVASITKEIDPATKSEIAGLFTGIKSAVKVDDTTLNILTNGPQPTLLVALSYLPMESAAWLKATPPEQIALTTNGTGPYMMDGDWKKGVSVAVKRFDGYWGTKPQITNVSYKFLEENQTRLASLLTGESDYMMNLLPEYVPQVKDKGLKVNAGPSNEFPLVRLTSFKGAMMKTDMRLAANYAVDKQGIIDSLYGGYATLPAGQAMNPTYGGFNPDLTAYPYDPAKAKELLKSAGYNGEKIQLYGETGRWLKDSEVVTAVADQLRAVGMNIELKIVGWNDYLDILLHRDKAPDMIFVSSGNDLFDASRVLNSWIATTGPLSAYGTTELDKQVTAADQAATLEERQTQQKALIKISHDDPYAVIIANSQNINGLSARLNYTQREDTRILVYQMTLSQ